jgi:hypothetical protein
MSEGIDLSSLETTSLSQSDQANANRVAHRFEFKADQVTIIMVAAGFFHSSNVQSQ